MKAVSGRELARVLERHGWKLMRVRGSHHVLVHAESQRRLVIPIHGNRSLAVGLIRDLMKEADLSESDLET